MKTTTIHLDAIFSYNLKKFIASLRVKKDKKPAIFSNSQQIIQLALFLHTTTFCLYPTLRIQTPNCRLWYLNFSTISDKYSPAT